MMNIFDAMKLNCLFLTVACMMVTSISHADEIEAKRPSIVLIYADDLGYSDLSCYGNGYHETPHIDRLMRDGSSVCTQAYSNAPLCAPSRIGLLTGRHCARAGCYEVTFRGDT